MHSRLVSTHPKRRALAEAAFSGINARPATRATWHATLRTSRRGTKIGLDSVPQSFHRLCT